MPSAKATFFLFIFCAFSALNAQVVSVLTEKESGAQVCHLTDMKHRVWSVKDDRFVYPLRVELNYKNGNLITARHLSSPSLVDYAKDSVYDLRHAKRFDYKDGFRVVHYTFASGVQPEMKNVLGKYMLFTDKNGLPVSVVDSAHGKRTFAESYQYNEVLSLATYSSERSTDSVLKPMRPFKKIEVKESGFTEYFLWNRKDESSTTSFDSIRSVDHQLQFIITRKNKTYNSERYEKYVFNEMGAMSTYIDYVRTGSTELKMNKKIQYFLDAYGRPVAQRDSEIIKFEQRKFSMVMNAENEMWTFIYETPSEGKVPVTVALIKKGDVLLADWFGDIGAPIQMIVLNEELKVKQYNQFRFGQAWLNPSKLPPGNYILVLITKEPVMGVMCRFRL